MRPCRVEPCGDPAHDGSILCLRHRRTFRKKVWRFCATSGCARACRVTKRKWWPLCPEHRARHIQVLEAVLARAVAECGGHPDIVADWQRRVARAKRGIYV